MVERPVDPFKKAPDGKVEGSDRKLDQSRLDVHATPDPALNPTVTLEKALADEVVIQNTKDSLGIGARTSGSEAPREQPKGLLTAEVKTKEDFRLAMDMMKHSFTDPTDLDSDRFIVVLNKIVACEFWGKEKATK